MTIKKNKKRRLTGTVYIVGAGPGDPGLLTIRARELLEQAGVVIHDWLVHEDILKYAAKARLIDVGKDPHSRLKKKPAESQEIINGLLLSWSRKEKTIVRLKGGDPFVFGRGAEEAAWLEAKGIPFEIVPGVSAGHAVPAYAGIPVTDRRRSSLAVFVTGHEDPAKGKSTVPWRRLAALNGTIVSFMGIQNLEKIVSELKAGGLSVSTPVCVIERGTLPVQRVVEGSLNDIARKVKAAGIASPALAVFGGVNEFRKDLAWFERKPLFGQTVLITRARDQAGTLKTMLEKKGARVLEYYGIRILPPRSWKDFDSAARNLSGYQWAVFTSPNGADSVFSRLKKSGYDARIFSGVKIAAIGDATRDRLRAFGVEPELVPESFHSMALSKALIKKNIKGKKILLLRTDIAPEFLYKELSAAGADVKEVTVYRTAGPDALQKSRLRVWMKEEKIDIITFTSSSTVRSFFSALGNKPSLKQARLVSIGPVTTQTLREYGFKPALEASDHNLPGLIAALESICKRTTQPL